MHMSSEDMIQPDSASFLPVFLFALTLVALGPHFLPVRRLPASLLSGRPSQGTGVRKHPQSRRKWEHIDLNSNKEFDQLTHNVFLYFHKFITC